MTRTAVLQHAGKCSGEVTYGFGYNWFDLLGIGGGYAGETELYPLTDRVYPAISDEPGWEAVIGGLDLLAPGIIRFSIPPDPLLTNRPGRINTGSVHLKRLSRVACWAEKNNCTILLDTFVIPEKYAFPKPAGLNMRYVRMAPRDNRLYARKFILPLLRHVVQELGLAAVRLFNTVNEPSFTGGGYRTPDNTPNPYRHYVEMYREIKEALERDRDLRGKIGLVGFDSVGSFLKTPERCQAADADIDPYVDLYSAHYYFVRFDWAPPCEHTGSQALSEVTAELEAMVSHCRSRGKRLLMPEVGNFYFGGPQNHDFNDAAGPAKPESVLLTAETVIRGLNAGLCGAAIWSLFNPDTIDGWWSVMAVKNGRLIRQGHKWHLYRLLSNSIRPGDKCFPLIPADPDSADRHLHGSLLVSPDKQTFLLINDSWCDSKKVRIKLPEAGAVSSVTRTVKDTSQVSCTTNRLAPIKEAAGDYLEDIVKPMSLNVYQLKSRHAAE